MIGKHSDKINQIHNFTFRLDVTQNFENFTPILSLEEGVSFVNNNLQQTYLLLKQPDQREQFLSSMRVLSLQFNITNDLIDLYEVDNNQIFGLVQFRPLFKLNSFCNNLKKIKETKELVALFDIEYANHLTESGITLLLSLLNVVKVSDQFIKLSKVSAIEGTKGIEEIKDTKTYTLKYVEPFKKIPVEITLNPSDNMNIDWDDLTSEQDNLKDLISNFFIKINTCFTKREQLSVIIKDNNDFKFGFKKSEPVSIEYKFVQSHNDLQSINEPTAHIRTLKERYMADFKVNLL